MMELKKRTRKAFGIRKKEKDSDSGSPDRDGGSQKKTNGAPNGFYGDIDWERYNSPELDDEGYSIRPDEESEEGKTHFFSSDESEEEEDHKKKFKIKIKPLPADCVISAPSVDELKASIGNIALSPSPMRRSPEEIARPRRAVPAAPIVAPTPAPANQQTVPEDTTALFGPPLETAFREQKTEGPPPLPPKNVPTSPPTTGAPSPDAAADANDSSRKPSIADLDNIFGPEVAPPAGEDTDDKWVCFSEHSPAGPPAPKEPAPHMPSSPPPPEEPAPPPPESPAPPLPTSPPPLPIALSPKEDSPPPLPTSPPPSEEPFLPPIRSGPSTPEDQNPPSIASSPPLALKEHTSPPASSPPPLSSPGSSSPVRPSTPSSVSPTPPPPPPRPPSRPKLPPGKPAVGDNRPFSPPIHSASPPPIAPLARAESTSSISSTNSLSAATTPTVSKELCVSVSDDAYVDKLPTFERHFDSFACSRGPSPLTMGAQDTLPVAAAFTETVNSFFKGADPSCVVKVIGEMVLSFPAGITRHFANNPSPAVLTFSITNYSRLEHVLPNPQLLCDTTTQSKADSKDFWVNMPNLISHLKKVAEQKPQATYYNVDMLKYQVSTNGLQSAPLNLAVSWRCEPTSTDLRIDYKYNGEAMSTPMALNNVQFLVPIDGGVSKLQAVLPPAVNGEQQRILWKIPDISKKSENGVGSLLARFQLTEGPSKPAPLAVQFTSEGSNLSGCDIELAGPGYRFSLVKKRFAA
uniref:SH3GL interacting endocytic adaptor 1 n=1 Tax=Xiphophorus maculatus TaxID=8083 RepID=A0A3B5Q5E1_XIPMA